MSAISTMLESPLASLMKKSDVCVRFGISPRTVENMVKAGDFPPPVRIGKQVFWSEKALTVWQAKLFHSQEAWVRNRHCTPEGI
ncbi:MAG TPA: helix-turn-helix domain-containing protein [Burkholderiaceae bacterium]|nr:helix-turn-helix domain-containing protein [Burkholderiaceae bacterium]